MIMMILKDKCNDRFNLLLNVILLSVNTAFVLICANFYYKLEKLSQSDWAKQTMKQYRESSGFIEQKTDVVTNVSKLLCIIVIICIVVLLKKIVELTVRKNLTIFGMMRAVGYRKGNIGIYVLTGQTFDFILSIPVFLVFTIIIWKWFCSNHLVQEILTLSKQPNHLIIPVSIKVIGLLFLYVMAVSFLVLRKMNRQSLVKQLKTSE